MPASPTPRAGPGPRAVLGTGLLLLAVTAVAGFMIYALTQDGRGARVMVALPGASTLPAPRPPAARDVPDRGPGGAGSPEQRTARLEAEVRRLRAALEHADRAAGAGDGPAGHGPPPAQAPAADVPPPSPHGQGIEPAAGPPPEPAHDPGIAAALGVTPAAGPPTSSTMLERLLPVPIMTGTGEPSATASGAMPEPMREPAPAQGAEAVPGPSLTAAAAAYRAGDYATAYAQWKPLADRDVAMAEFGLGALLVEGRLQAPDRVAGYRWLARAAGQGFAPAESLARDVAAEMTPVERQRAGLP